MYWGLSKLTLYCLHSELVRIWAEHIVDSWNRFTHKATWHNDFRKAKSEVVHWAFSGVPVSPRLSAYLVSNLSDLSIWNHQWNIAFRVWIEHRNLTAKASLSKLPRGLTLTHRKIYYGKHSTNWNTRRSQRGDWGCYNVTSQHSSPGSLRDLWRFGNEPHLILINASFVTNAFYRPAGPLIVVYFELGGS